MRPGAASESVLSRLSQPAALEVEGGGNREPRRLRLGKPAERLRGAGRRGRD